MSETLSALYAENERTLRSRNRLQAHCRHISRRKGCSAETIIPPASASKRTGGRGSPATTTVAPHDVGTTANAGTT